jgi:hypothetical protein
METGVEEGDAGVVELWIRAEPGGASGGGCGGIGGNDAVGRDAGRRGRCRAEPRGQAGEVLSFLGAGGVPAGDGGEGTRMNEGGGEAFFPRVVGESPRFKHAAGGKDERGTEAVGSGAGVMEGA